jgi:hypothetical protein
VLKDIREAETAEYGQTLRQRWGALLSYHDIGPASMTFGTVD